MKQLPGLYFLTCIYLFLCTKLVENEFMFCALREREEVIFDNRLSLPRTS